MKTLGRNIKRMMASVFLFSLLITLSCTICYCQSSGCADTLKTYLYSSSSLIFQSDPIFYSIPTIDNGIVNIQNAQFDDSIILFKIDNNGQPVWAKSIRTYGNSVWQNIQELSNGYLLLTSVDTSISACPQGCRKSLHLFLDNNGNFFYQLNYNNQSNDDGWQICNSGPNQSIVFAGTKLASNGGGIIIERDDTLLIPPLTVEERWRNSFVSNNALPEEYNMSNLYVVNNIVYIGGTYNVINNPQHDAGIWAIQLDYNTGNIISQKAYRLTNSPSSSDGLTILNNASFSKSPNNKFTFTVEIKHSESSQIEIGYIQLDANLNISNSPIAVSPINLDGTNAYPILNRAGNALYYLPEYHGLSYYAFIDSTNKLTTQQYHVTNILNNSPVFQYNFKNNNVVNMTMAKGLNGSVYLQVSDIPLGFISNSGCVTDSNEIFATSRYLPFEETNLNWQNLFDHDVVSIALPQTIPANDFIMQSQIECQQQSLCNNIKLSGNNNLCFSDSAFVFSATKNSECLKKISWLADTTFVSSISPVGDSSVSVQFKKPGNLYLHASIAGCGIADSLLINIKAPIPNVSLGSDTILCQNSIDTLRPTNPYQKYLWQDGSTDSFYVAKDSGTYKLTATDICNNVSSAEIKISYDSSKLSAGGNIELCKLLDTSLTASNGFTGYQWQPANAIIGNALSQTIKIAPAETIAYIVSATSFSGCLLSDTVKVAVEDCLNRLIVPSAFTPNNDGKNDIIKPIVYGVLEKYDFAIYNRWGEIVFRSTKQNEGWNGTINGVLQNEGVYAWFCHYQFVGEKEKISKGTLVLAK